MENKVDNVNHPSHYNQFRQEVLDTIEDWTMEYSLGYVAYCIGNVMKYIARAPFKHSSPLEDLEKAEFYLRKAIEKQRSQEG